MSITSTKSHMDACVSLVQHTLAPHIQAHTCRQTHTRAHQLTQRWMHTQTRSAHQDVHHSWHQASKEARLSLKHFGAIAHSSPKDASKDIATRKTKQSVCETTHTCRGCITTSNTQTWPWMQCSLITANPFCVRP